MKYLLFLILFLPFVSIAQKSDTTFFKGARKITVKNNLSAEENYKLTVRKLIDEGFFIQTKDNDLHYLTTQSKNIPKTSYSYFLNVRTKDNEIIFEGKFKTGVEIEIYGVTSKDDFEDIVYKGWAGNKLTFKSMENAALMFSMPLTYSN